MLAYEIGTNKTPPPEAEDKRLLYTVNNALWSPLPSIQIHLMLTPSVFNSAGLIGHLVLLASHADSILLSLVTDRRLDSFSEFGVDFGKDVVEGGPDDFGFCLK